MYIDVTNSHKIAETLKPVRNFLIKRVLVELLLFLKRGLHPAILHPLLIGVPEIGIEQLTLSLHHFCPIFTLFKVTLLVILPDELHNIHQLRLVEDPGFPIRVQTVQHPVPVQIPHHRRKPIVLVGLPHILTDLLRNGLGVVQKRVQRVSRDLDENILGLSDQNAFLDEEADGELADLVEQCLEVQRQQLFESHTEGTPSLVVLVAELHVVLVLAFS